MKKIIFTVMVIVVLLTCLIFCSSTGEITSQPEQYMYADSLIKELEKVNRILTVEEINLEKSRDRNVNLCLDVRNIQKRLEEKKVLEIELIAKYEKSQKGLKTDVAFLNEKNLDLNQRIKIAEKQEMKLAKQIYQLNTEINLLEKAARDTIRFFQLQKKIFGIKF